MFLKELFTNKLKGSKEDKENLDGKAVADSNVVKEEMAPTSDRDTNLNRKTLRKSKYEKMNKALQRSGHKRKSVRLSHVVKSYHKKQNVPLDKQVNVYDVLEKPVVTEKSATLSESNVYTFFVRKNATKHTISDAIEALYNVKPAKVRISKTPSKKKRLRTPGRQNEFGSTKQKKKAYVFLRKGDTINLT